MTTPDSLDQQWLKSDDPIATVMAEVRLATTLQSDLDKYAEQPGLKPEERQKIVAASEQLHDRLRQADVFVDRYATATGMPPPQNRLTGTEPKPYPQSGTFVEKTAWFTTESVRLLENINERLNINRAAKAEKALGERALKGAADPKRLDDAAWQIRAADPNVHALLTEQKLPATRILLNDVTAHLNAQPQQPNKLRKKNPMAEAAASRSRSVSGSRRKPVRDSEEVSLAVGAAIALPAPGNALAHGKRVTEDRSLFDLSAATIRGGKFADASQALVAATAGTLVPGTERRGRSESRSSTPQVRAASLPAQSKSRSAGPR